MAIGSFQQYKHKLLGVFISLLMCLFAQNLWAKDMDVLQGNIRFKLGVEGHGIKYFVSVNDVLVYKQFDQNTQNSFELPISHLIHPENNKFSILGGAETAETEFPTGAAVKLTLIIEDRDSEVSYKLPVLSLNGKEVHNNQAISGILKDGRYNLSSNGKVVFGNGNIVLNKTNRILVDKVNDWFDYSRVVSAPNNLPLWSFFNSDNLPDYDAMSSADRKASIKELFVEYKKIQDALANNDIDSIMPLFSERNKELDIAFGYESGRMEQMLRDFMQDAIDDPAWKLEIRTADGAAIYREDNNKLVSLTRDKLSDFLGFRNSSGMYLSLEIKLRRENGKWIISR